MTTIQKQLTKGVSLIKIKQVNDNRGSLCFAENTELPFPIQRVFWIHSVLEGKTRGGHAHMTCAEVIFPVAGCFDIWTDDGEDIQTFHMNHPNEGIYIGPGTWCELNHFSHDAVCVVLASESYSANGYINSYDDFKKRSKIKTDK